MLINFSKLLKFYNINLNGILHIGAHICEEIKEYEKYIERNKILWIEAIPEKVIASKQLYPNILIENAVISDTKEIVKFNISNNFESSSILELGTHKQHHPHIHYTNNFQVETTIITEILNKPNYKNIHFNFLNLDIQGAELKALKGFGNDINLFDYIYTEVNIEEVYINSGLMYEIDECLNNFNFVRINTSMTKYKWGDAFYIKKNLLNNNNNKCIYTNCNC